MVLINKNLTVNYTLTRHSDKLHGKRLGLTGRISLKMLKTLGFYFNPRDDTIIMVCGPPTFENQMLQLYERLGYVKGTNLFKY